MNRFELKRVQIAIEKSGYKKKFIAEKCDVSPARLSQFLSGNFEIPDDIETKLKNLFGL